MRAYSNMSTNEFVSQLRDIAIKANARPAVIDCIDAIIDGPTEDDIAKQISEAEDAAYSDAVHTCAHEWRMARRRAVAALDAIGLTPEQMEQVLEVIDDMESEE
jgi:hypothetical protein